MATVTTPEVRSAVSAAQERVVAGICGTFAAVAQLDCSLHCWQLLARLQLLLPRPRRGSAAQQLADCSLQAKFGGRRPRCCIPVCLQDHKGAVAERSRTCSALHCQDNMHHVNIMPNKIHLQRQGQTPANSKTGDRCPSQHKKTLGEVKGAGRFAGDWWKLY